MFALDLNRAITIVNTNAYVVNGYTSTGVTSISKCSVDASTGMLSSCVALATPSMWSTFDVATGIVTNGATKMYFVQIDNALANACDVQGDGTLVSTTSAG